MLLTVAMEQRLSGVNLFIGIWQWMLINWQRHRKTKRKRITIKHSARKYSQGTKRNIVSLILMITMKIPAGSSTMTSCGGLSAWHAATNFLEWMNIWNSRKLVSNGYGMARKKSVIPARMTKKTEVCFGNGNPFKIRNRINSVMERWHVSTFRQLLQH